VKFSNLIKVGLFSVVSALCASQSLAATITIDLTGIITETYIQYVVDDNAVVEDAALWGISSGLPIGSTLNFSTSYSTNAPSIWHFIDGDIYNGTGLSVNSSFFHAFIPNTEVAVRNGIGEADNFGENSDGLSFVARASYNTGVKINFQNEIYYLITSSMGMTDDTGKAFRDDNLPTDQSLLDTFWLNNPSGLGWSHFPVGTFELLFVKDPLVNSDTAQVWPNGKTLYVKGDFDAARLTNVEVPEPAGLLLAVIGMMGLIVKRTRKN